MRPFSPRWIAPSRPSSATEIEIDRSIDIGGLGVNPIDIDRYTYTHIFIYIYIYIDEFPPSPRWTAPSLPSSAAPPPPYSARSTPVRPAGCRSTLTAAQWDSATSPSSPSPRASQRGARLTMSFRHSG